MSKARINWDSSIGYPGILEPLRSGQTRESGRQDKRGVTFPYTPTVTVSESADYDQYSHTHSNYPYNAWVKSMPGDITVSGEFTSNTNDEAKYSLAVIHFFRTVVKGYTGASKTPGRPPNICTFSYLGEKMFNEVPVVVKQFDIQLPKDVDYVEVPGQGTYVPVLFTLTTTLAVSYSPLKTKEFNLQDFRKGTLVNQGWI